MVAALRPSRAEVLEARRAQYASKVLDAGAAKVDGADGGLSLWREAVSLHELAAGGVLDADEVDARLTTAALGAGMKAAKVAETLRRARTKAAGNPRGLPDEGYRGAAPVVSPSGRGNVLAVPVAVPVDTGAADAARSARASVWALAERDPARWPAEVLAWCEAVGIPPEEAAALGAGVLDGARVRELGEVIGERAGLRSSDGKRWHPAAWGSSPAGLWVPAFGPGDEVPSSWAWRPVSPVTIGGQVLKMMRTARGPGAGWWPFGVPAVGEVLAIVEGEKDWLAMAEPARAAGVAVLGVPGAQWSAAWSSMLAGRRAVLVALDADAAGDDCAAKVIEAAAVLGVPAVRVVPPAGKGKDWADAIAAGVTRAELVRGWCEALPVPAVALPGEEAGDPLPRDVAGLYGAFLWALERDPVTWPGEVIEALGGLDAAEDAVDIGAGVVGERARELLRSMAATPSGRAVLVDAGFVAAGRPWGPVARGAAPALVAPLFGPASSGPVGFASMVGEVIGEAWPVGLRWPCDGTLGRGRSSRPVVVVGEVLDALSLGALAFGLPGEDGKVLSLDVLAAAGPVDWAEVIEGRRAVLVATGGHVAAEVVAAARAAGVPVAMAGRVAGVLSWREAAARGCRRAIVERWRTKVREVLQ